MLRKRDGEAIQPPMESPVDLEARARILACAENKAASATGPGEHAALEAHAAAAWVWWRGTLGSPRFVAAPMIGQSDPAFRRLVMRHGGVGLCYSPMYLATEVNAGVHDHEFDADSRHDCHDRPLFIQLAGCDPAAMAAAGLRVQRCCDGVDINFGCPQRCAEEGGYGAPFLEGNVLGAIAVVEALRAALDVPISVKIRLQPFNISSNGEPGHHPVGLDRSDDEDTAVTTAASAAAASWEDSVAATVRVARQLVAAGASVLCLHGRFRKQRDHQVKAACPL